MEALSTLLYFLVTIGILVSFHEFGHYAAARLWVDAVITQPIPDCGCPWGWKCPTTLRWSVRTTQGCCRFNQGEPFVFDFPIHGAATVVVRQDDRLASGEILGLDGR